MEYRLASDADVALLARLNHRLVRDEGHSNPLSAKELEGRMRAWLAGDYTAVLFESDGNVIGYALYRPAGTGIYLRQFFISPDQRRRGFGRAAMAILSKELWPSGVTVSVDALIDNRSAVDFWRAVGFSDYAITLKKQT